MTERIDLSGLTEQQIITLYSTAFLLKQPNTKKAMLQIMDLMEARTINADDFKERVDRLFSQFLKSIYS